MSENEMETTAAESVVAEADQDDLQTRVVELEARLTALEGRLPDTWLLSQSLWKRMITVYGYYFVIGLIIAIPIMACSFFFVMFGILMGLTTGSY